jgi:hypothetical protein
MLVSDAHRVSHLRRVWLLREYVDAAEEAALLAAATGAAARWTHVSGRRLQAHGARALACLASSRSRFPCFSAARSPPRPWRLSRRAGGTVHERAGLLPAPLPKWLLPLLARLQADAADLFAAAPLNHVLVRRSRRSARSSAAAIACSVELTHFAF